MKHIAIFIIGISLFGCRGRYYTIVNNFDRGNAGFIEINDSYDLYVRKQYKYLDEETGRFNLSNEHVPNSEHGGLIEVEYIFVSTENENVVYISTVPDKYQNYYRNHFLSGDSVNAYDFNVFHFGKINGKKVNFIGTKGTQVQWEIMVSDSILQIDRIAEFKNEQFIQEIPIIHALRKPLIFTRQESFRIYLHNFVADPHKQRVVGHVDGRFYFLPMKSVSNSCRVDLYMMFDAPVAKLLFIGKRERGTDQDAFKKRSIIHFSPIRVKFCPSLIKDN